MSREHTSSLIRTLLKALDESAQDVIEHTTLDQLPDKWLRILPSDELFMADASDGIAGSNNERDVPEGTEAWRMRLGRAGARYFIIAPVTSLKLSVGDAANALMASVRLRARLTEDERTDQYLILIAPPGAKDDLAWQRASRQMEQNESFCRIFVWLSGTLPEHWPAEASAFSRRLFLTRLSIAQGNRGDIAPISSLFTVLPPTMRAAWEAILLNDGQSTKPGSSKTTAERLIDSVASEEGEANE